MGINPVHFAGCYAGNFFPLRNRCADLWVEESWQFADIVSRGDIRRGIRDAEDDLAAVLGWYPAPKWQYEEVHQFERFYRKDATGIYGRNTRGRRSSMQTDFGYVNAPGRRATTEVPDAVLVYSDEDGDGFAETAKITVTTTVTNANELHVFYPDTEGDPGWRIFPERSKTISAGIATIYFYSWQLVSPTAQNVYPTTENLDNYAAIDISGLTETPVVTTNMLTAVDVYRVYNDTTEVSATFYWTPKAPMNLDFGYYLQTPETTALETQDGCLYVTNARLGLIAPAPATYNAVTGNWEQDIYNHTRDPDFVKLWYYGGKFSNEYLGGRIYDPLPAVWAKVIAQIVTARLERELCSCGNTTGLSTLWQKDAADMTNNLSVTPNELSNPFGTRYGEIMAWRTVKREKDIIEKGGAV